MTEDEKKLLVADLKAEIIKELTGKDLRVAQDISRPLQVLYSKYRDALYKKYGTVTYAQAWDCIRKLAVFKTGKKYVRDLLPSEEVEAAEFAENILNQLGLEES